MPSSVTHKARGGGINQSSVTLMLLSGKNSPGFARNTPSTTTAPTANATLKSLQSAPETETFNLAHQDIGGVNYPLTLLMSNLSVPIHII